MIVMPGVGVGCGDGNIWACAEHAAATVRAKPIAKARPSLRPTPVSPAREGRDAQRMCVIPNGSAGPKQYRTQSTRNDLPLVAGERQSPESIVTTRIAAGVVRLP